MSQSWDLLVGSFRISARRDGADTIVKFPFGHERLTRAQLEQLREDIADLIGNLYPEGEGRNEDDHD